MNAEHDNPNITLTVSIITEDGTAIQSSKKLTADEIRLSDNLPYLILEQEAEKIAEAYQTIRQHAP